MCTLEKRGRVWVLTLNGDAEHRLSPDVLDSVISALDEVRHESQASPSPGSALVTMSTGKFFSNGFDLDWARSGSFAPRLRLMSEKLRSVITALISLPIPTVAAVTGHASGAGFMLAIAHDYVVMRKDRGFLYLPELDIGMTFMKWMMTLVRTKSPSPVSLRDLVLQSRRFTAADAAKVGLIHIMAANTEETVTEAVRLAEDLSSRNWDGNVYSAIRKAAFPELVAALDLANVSETNVGSRL